MYQVADSASDSDKTELFDIVVKEKDIIPNVPSGDKIFFDDWMQEGFLRLFLKNLELKVSDYSGKLHEYDYKNLVEWSTFRSNLNSILKLKNTQSIIFENGKLLNVIEHSSHKDIKLLNLYKENSFVSSTPFQSYTFLQKKSFNFSDFNNNVYYFRDAFKFIGDKYYTGFLDGKLLFTSGFGSLGISQVLGAYLNGLTVLIAEPDEKLLRKRVQLGYCDSIYYDVKTAIEVVLDSKKNYLPKIIGVCSNSTNVLTEFVNMGITPNIILDATSEDIDKYIPDDYSFESLKRLQNSDPDYYSRILKHTIRNNIRLKTELKKRGALIFESGNSFKKRAELVDADNIQVVSDVLDKILFDVINDNNYIDFYITPLSFDSEDLFIIDDIINSKFYYSEEGAYKDYISLSNKIIHDKSVFSKFFREKKDNLIKLLLELNNMILDGELSAPLLLSMPSFSSGINPSNGFDINSSGYEIEKYLSSSFYDMPLISFYSFQKNNDNSTNIYLENTFLLDGNQKNLDAILNSL